MKQPLTKQQRAIFDYIGATIYEKGYAPTLAEIGAAFGLRSLATVHKHIANLQEKGYLWRRFNHARSIEIVPPPECCAECGRPFTAQPAA